MEFHSQWGKVRITSQMLTITYLLEMFLNLSSKLICRNTCIKWIMFSPSSNLLFPKPINQNVWWSNLDILGPIIYKSVSLFIYYWELNLLNYWFYFPRWVDVGGGYPLLNNLQKTEMCKYWNSILVPANESQQKELRVSS